MRPIYVALVLVAGTGMIGCSRDNGAGSEGPAARQAGRDAYRASRAAKQDAKQAAREVQRAGKDFQQGWNEAKHEDTTRRRK